jgi:transposase InsO family protein
MRADKPDGIWHIDVTVIRLLDGTKAYLQAVIDNFSRRILAWRLYSQLEPAATAPLLVKAKESRDKLRNDADSVPQSVMIDGGIENINNAVNELCDKGLLKLILAQTDILFSNSMIEAFWRSLKHQWLYLNNLDTINTLRKLVSFYVDEYNSTLPHSVLKGQTPDKVYYGTGGDVPIKLHEGKAAARKVRLEANRNLE